MNLPFLHRTRSRRGISFSQAEAPSRHALLGAIIRAKPAASASPSAISHEAGAGHGGTRTFTHTTPAAAAPFTFVKHPEPQTKPENMKPLPSTPVSAPAEQGAIADKIKPAAPIIIKIFVPLPETSLLSANKPAAAGWIDDVLRPVAFARGDKIKVEIHTLDQGRPHPGSRFARGDKIKVEIHTQEQS